MQIIGLCLCAAILALALKKNSPELSLLLVLAAVLMLLGKLLGQASELLVQMQALLEQTGLPQRIFLPVLRTLGIALAARLGSELCRDAGQNALAAVVDLGGGLCGLIAALPLLQGIMTLFMEWL